MRAPPRCNSQPCRVRAASTPRSFGLSRSRSSRGEPVLDNASADTADAQGHEHIGAASAGLCICRPLHEGRTSNARIAGPDFVTISARVLSQHNCNTKTLPHGIRTRLRRFTICPEGSRPCPLCTIHSRERYQMNTNSPEAERNFGAAFGVLRQ
jgi:hypothetical protein